MSRKNIRVCVVGLGYIGLPTAALIASRGATVIGVDIDKNVVDTIASGHIHIAEADLEGLVQKVVFSKKLLARDAPEPADVFMIAVPTPLSGNKKPVVDHVLAAAKSIAPHLAKGNLVILESTSPSARPSRSVTYSRNCGPISACPETRKYAPTYSSPIARSACCPAASSLSLCRMTAASAA